VFVLQVSDVLRAAAGSAGFDTLVGSRKATLVRALSPCDPASARLVLDRLAASPTCRLDLSALGHPSSVPGCVATDLALEAAVEGEPGYVVSRLEAGSLLHALGLRTGDLIPADARALVDRESDPAFELPVVRAGVKKTLRCAITAEGRASRLHPAYLLRAALPPAPGSVRTSPACTVDESAFVTTADTTTVDSTKATGVDLPCLLRAARTVPAFRDGKAHGLKLFGVRRDTLFSRLGLQNGDTVKSINGHDLDSPERALEAYRTLREEKRFTVVLERRGEPKTLTVLVK